MGSPRYNTFLEEVCVLRLVVGIVSLPALLAGAFPIAVAAHEGEVHLTEGFALSPMAIAIFGGSILGLFLLGFLLWFWASRSMKRKEAQRSAVSLPGPQPDNSRKA